MVLAQVTQDPRLSSVLEDLFSSDGAEVYLKDLALYVAPGETTSFEELLVVAKARGEVAFGLQIGSTDAADLYGIRVNPSKDRRARFAPKPGDRLIVLAEDDG